MIIYGLLELLLAVLGVLFLPIKMALFPSAVANVVLTIIQAVGTGAGVMKTFCHWSYISTLLSFILGMNVMVSAYHVIMWGLKKIPFLNIK